MNCKKNCLNLGRHPCLWCTRTSQLIKVPRELRTPCSLKSLSSLQADLLSFKSEGKGNIKAAKHYKNVSSDYFFPIPINQVKCACTHVFYCFLWTRVFKIFGCTHGDLDGCAKHNTTRSNHHNLLNSHDVFFSNSQEVWNIYTMHV